MRIIRFVAPNGRYFFGEDHQDGTATVLAGTAPVDVIRTSQRERVGTLIAPIEPADIICIGRNYRSPTVDAHSSHSSEPDSTLEVFLKPSTALQNPNDSIIIPRFDGLDPQLDCEGELAVIIGRHARNVSETDALHYVFGYTIANDVTARAFQTPTGPPLWMRGKGFDTFCPLGPAIITADEIPDPHTLTLRTIINGAVVREGHTRDMIRSVPQLIAALSRHMTLRVRSVILTGAPPARAGSSPIHSSTEVRVECERIGTLINHSTAQ